MSACKTPWLGWTQHRWGPWKDKQEGNLRKVDTKAIIGIAIIQERRCLNPDCNMLELRTARSEWV